MLPTKGYFQDIQCPYYNSSCGRPYCHFRHRKKPTESLEESVSESEKDDVSTIPTYKPTPKSELANIHNKSHIPISYVPDLAFRPDRKSRPLPKFDKPTYKPTPLSILSSASKRGSSISEENGEHTEAIKEIKQNIANVEYDPTLSLKSAVDIDFEDLSTEFDLIDEIINSGGKSQRNAEGTRENISNVKERGKTEDSKDNNEKVSRSDLEILSEQECVKETDIKQEHIKSTDVKTSTEKNCDKLEKTNEKNLEKKERSREKYSDKGSNKVDRNSERKEKHSEKHAKNGKSKKNQDEKNIYTPEKDEKSKSSKNKGDKHKSSGKEKSTISKEKSNKEKSSKEKNEKNPKDKSHKGSSSSRDKHLKEEKKDRKEEKQSSHKSKHKSKDRSRSRSKERKKSRECEKGKDKHCDKDRHTKNKSKDTGSNKNKDRDKKHEKSRSNKKEEYRKISYEESSDDSDNNFPLLTENFEDNLSDVDFDDEDETMLECYKIFNEYKPPEKSSIEEIKKMSIEEDFAVEKDDDIEKFLGRKRVAHTNAESSMTSKLQPPSKPKPINSPGQILTNRYKLAKLAQANREQEFITNEIKQPTAAIKRPAPTLLEAARQHKFRKEHSQSTITEAGSLVDHIIKGTTKPSVPQQKVTVKKIAPAQNVGLIEKAKERISKIKQTQIKTVAQTQKGSRVAHIPEVSLTDIPDVLQADKSKLPVNVRTRFLTMIADECIKLYISKEEAFSRALNEEFSCYEKCKVIATYRNSAMLAVNRLRKEIQERQKLGLGLMSLGEDSGRDSTSEFKGRNFYNHVKKWILKEEELDIHGYPRESEQHHGHAVIKNQKAISSTNLDENQRICCRCHKIYQVDDDGWPLYEEECIYHPLKKRTIRGEQTYLCCRTNDEFGCATSDTHVSETLTEGELEGFQTTMDPESDDDARSYAVYALDCEMCYTTKGLELTRVSIVDTDCKTVYESLVKPLNPIIDYNTRFSGITKEQMDKTSTSILQIQANILHLCNSRTILVGHSLESDMKALKIVHGTIIDTAVLFPHKMGLPHKRALKALASEYLRKIIQNDISGHDSAEDAITCMELIKWKLKDDLKIRGSK